MLGYGGGQSLDTRVNFSPTVRALLYDVGIELERFEDWYDADWDKDRGLARCMCLFDAEERGKDRLVVYTAGNPPIFNGVHR